VTISVVGIAGDRRNHGILSVATAMGPEKIKPRGYSLVHNFAPHDVQKSQIWSENSLILLLREFWP